MLIPSGEISIIELELRMFSFGSGTLFLFLFCYLCLFNCVSLQYSLILVIFLLSKRFSAFLIR